MHAYAIVCQARTGSNYLVSLLGQHPEITAHNELFHEQTIWRLPTPIVDDAILRQRDADPLAYLQAVMAECSTPVFGFKHLLFYDESVIDFVMRGDFKVIILERENVLAQFSSMAIAHQTGQWTLNPDDRPVEPHKLPWDEADFEVYRRDYVEAYAELYSMTSQRRAPWMRLRYVDLFTPRTIRRVFAFLAVSQQVPINLNTIRRQNSSHIVERFIQPALVQAYLARIGRPDWAQEILSAASPIDPL